MVNGTSVSAGDVRRAVEEGLGGSRYKEYELPGLRRGRARARARATRGAPCTVSWMSLKGHLQGLHHFDRTEFFCTTGDDGRVEALFAVIWQGADALADVARARLLRREDASGDGRARGRHAASSSCATSRRERGPCLIRTQRNRRPTFDSMGEEMPADFEVDLRADYQREDERWSSGQSSPRRPDHLRRRRLRLQLDVHRLPAGARDPLETRTGEGEPIMTQQSEDHARDPAVPLRDGRVGRRLDAARPGLPGRFA